MAKFIMHIDANSAYLSWEAAYRLQQGYKLDLRTVPAVVGGDEKSRHGIVLAKSIPAKKYKIQTGEPLRDAFGKCPKLISVKPNYWLYMKASAAMVEILKEYTPIVQRFSIDECFIEWNDLADQRDPVDVANEIRERIWKELGYTVNIGVSTVKILSKMASDFRKPNKVHTLFPDQIEEKMWPLPVGDLFMVGRQTEKKLVNLGILTIGDLAKFDTELLVYHLKSYAYLIQSYAKGTDNTPVRKSNRLVMKGIGNGMTSKYNVVKREEAYLHIMSLTESVTARLRATGNCAGLVSVGITSTDFISKSRQRKLSIAIDSTTYIGKIAKELFDELWDGSTAIRKFKVRVNDLHGNDYVQLSLLETFDFEKQKKLDVAIDEIRKRFGTNAIQRAAFIKSGIRSGAGGPDEDEYPLMTSIL